MFVTVTFDRHSGSAAESIARSQNMFDLWFRRLRREFGRDLAYFSALERHQDGYVHFHLLLRGAELIALFELEESDDHEVEDRLRAHAVAVGFGGQFRATVTKDIFAIAHELCKADHQIVRDLPRSKRRFRSSGRGGNGKPSTFFLDAAKGMTETLAPYGPAPAFPDAETFGEGGDRMPRVAILRVVVVASLRRWKNEDATPPDHIVLDTRVACDSRYAYAPIILVVPLTDPRVRSLLLQAIDPWREDGAPEPEISADALDGRTLWIRYVAAGHFNPWTRRKQGEKEADWAELVSEEEAEGGRPALVATERDPEPDSVPEDAVAPEPFLEGRYAPKAERTTLSVALIHAPLWSVVGHYAGRQTDIQVGQALWRDYEKVRTPSGEEYRELMFAGEINRERVDELTQLRNYADFLRQLIAFPVPKYAPAEVAATLKRVELEVQLRAEPARTKRHG